jgi:hypothetical protein
LFSDWEPGDNPWVCHRSSSPLCNFVCYILELERVQDATACSSAIFVTAPHHDAEQKINSADSCCLELSSEIPTTHPPTSVSSSSTSDGVHPFLSAEGDERDVLVSRVRLGSKTKVEWKKSCRSVKTSPPTDEHQRTQEELSQIRFLVHSSRHAAQQFWDQIAADVAIKIDRVSFRLNEVSNRISRLQGCDWLCAKKEELKLLQEHIYRSKAERCILEAENHTLSATLEESRDAVSKLREINVEVSELEDRKASAIASCRLLEDQIASCLIRIEVRCSSMIILLNFTL